MRVVEDVHDVTVYLFVIRPDFNLIVRKRNTYTLYYYKFHELASQLQETN